MSKIYMIFEKNHQTVSTFLIDDQKLLTPYFSNGRLKKNVFVYAQCEWCGRWFLLKKKKWRFCSHRKAPFCAHDYGKAKLTVEALQDFKNMGARIEEKVVGGIRVAEISFSENKKRK